MTTVAVIQARMGSSRLQGKVLTDLGGKPVLAWVVDAARAIRGVDRVAVATSTAVSDQAVADWCAANSIACYCGPEDDVLARFVMVAEAENADTIVRLTGDCPLLDAGVCSQVVALRKRTGADYASNCNPPTWPDGLDCEVLTRKALDAAAAGASLASEREHVTPYVRNRQHLFKTEALTCPLPGLQRERWTLDDRNDLEFLQAVVGKLPQDAPPTMLSVLEILDREPELRSLNSAAKRNEGLDRSLAADAPTAERSYTGSWTMLESAERLIPLGSQTFSKSRIQYPEGQAPLFLTHGQGGRVWDVDGNEYVDLVCGLLCVGLGYCDPDVDTAIRGQLNNGISFSLATELEAKLASHLVELIPCAEKVRFGKNGTDATSAAVRIARAATGRDRIAVCGYHGWQDWYIGSTSRNKGVPPAVRELTDRVPFGDLEAVDELFTRHKGQHAALILEPAGAVQPTKDYLAGLKDLVHSHGALLVFDEVITGFRYSLGGAQSLYGVTPDLAAFGKAMGNGMPISAILGRGDLMDEMEEVFYSGTFGGETLSLAAAIAVIEKMRAEPVITRLWETGETLAAALCRQIAESGLDGVIEVKGAPPWAILGFNDHPGARSDAIKTFFMKEMLGQGVLTLGTHNVCYAHDPADVAKVASAYGTVLPRLAIALQEGNLEAELPCPVIEPVFKVRGG